MERRDICLIATWLWFYLCVKEHQSAERRIIELKVFCTFTTIKKVSIDTRVNDTKEYVFVLKVYSYVIEMYVFAKNSDFIQNVCMIKS